MFFDELYRHFFSFYFFVALIKKSLNDVEHTRSELQITSEITIICPFTGFMYG